MGKERQGAKQGLKGAMILGTGRLEDEDEP